MNKSIYEKIKEKKKIPVMPKFLHISPTMETGVTNIENSEKVPT